MTSDLVFRGAAPADYEGFVRSGRDDSEAREEVPASFAREARHHVASVEFTAIDGESRIAALEFDAGDGCDWHRRRRAREVRPFARTGSRMQ